MEFVRSAAAHPCVRKTSRSVFAFLNQLRVWCLRTFETVCSNLLEAKRLADAADLPNSVYVEGTDADEPLPTPAASVTVPDRVSTPDRKQP